MIRARAVTLLGPPGGDVGGLNGALAFRDGSSAAPADGHRGSPMTQRERHTPEGGAPATPALTAPPGAGLGCVWEDLLPSLPPARGRELLELAGAAGGALRPPAPRRQRLRGPGRSRTPARRAARPPQRTDARPPSPPPDPDRLQRRRPRRRPARRRRPRAADAGPVPDSGASRLWKIPYCRGDCGPGRGPRRARAPAGADGRRRGLRAGGPGRSRRRLPGALPRRRRIRGIAAARPAPAGLRGAPPAVPGTDAAGGEAGAGRGVPAVRRSPQR